jgi:ATP-dependent RNA helicase DeaD
MENFKKLGLDGKILAALERKGFKDPSPVQAEVIPLLLQSAGDIIAMAQTGTGKTAAFGLPICQRLAATGITKALVLTPTRELALQVHDEIKSFTTELNVLAVYGGQPFHEQARALKKGIDIVVGTPGRVIDAIERGKLEMEFLEFIVLDEVDEMLNMGFIEDIEFILGQTPENCQRLMFSATLAPRVEAVAKNYLKKPTVIKVNKSTDTANLISHIYYETNKKHRLEALTRILMLEDDFYGLIFCQTKAETELLTAELNTQGITAEYLHGDIAQNSRETILNRFRNKKSRLLIATDVAARGIDIDSLSHVINFSVPDSTEAYTHRCGRTGRRGQTGKAITLVSSTEMGRFKRIQKTTGFNVEKAMVPDGRRIASARLDKFKETLEKVDVADINQEIASSLLKKYEPNDIVSRLLQYFNGKDFDPNSYTTLAATTMDKPRDTFIRLEKGIADDFTGSTIVTFIEKKGGIPAKFINNLHLHRHFCIFSVPSSDAEAVVDKLNKRSGGSSPRPMARLDEGSKPRGGGGSRNHSERRRKR